MSLIDIKKFNKDFEKGLIPEPDINDIITLISNLYILEHERDDNEIKRIAKKYRVYPF